MINEQFLSFQSDSRDRMRLSRIPSFQSTLTLNDASISVQENAAARLKTRREEDVSSVPFVLDLHTQTFGLLQSILVQSLSARAGATSELTAYLNTAFAALSILQRHLTPICQAVPTVRSVLLPEANVKHLYEVLSVTLPRLITAPDAEFSDEQQRKLWRSVASTIEKSIADVIDAGFDLFFPSAAVQFITFGDLMLRTRAIFVHASSTKSSGAGTGAAPPTPLTPHEQALLSQLSTRFLSRAAHFKLFSEVEALAASDRAKQTATVRSIERVVLDLLTLVTADELSLVSVSASGVCCDDLTRLSLIVIRIILANRSR